MTEKELHKLRRQDLLQMLLSQSRESAHLRGRISELEKSAEDMQASYDRLVAKLDEKDAQLEHLKARLNEKDAQLAALRAEADEAPAVTPAELRELLSELRGSIRSIEEIAGKSSKKSRKN